MKYKLSCKIWLEWKGKKVFGDGPCDILQRVERTGSLRAAAKEIRMSYSQAWRLIDLLENELGFPLLNKRAGGSSGGGSELTPQGRELLRRFAPFREEAQQALQELYQKYFADA
ncbi:MAG TPA: LysR family transcriptional regulator [Firmicutes bacterium]|nr:LysR family transcriptional regulator [Bacillota bacterium]